MVWVAWSNDTGSSAGGNVVIGRDSNGRLVTGDDPEKKECAGPLVWVLVWG